MRDMGPNLASRPFANERPVKRTTLLVWALALVLLAINIFLYQRHLSSQYGQRQAARDLEAQIGAEEETIRQRRTELQAIELDRQNEKVVFLNAQIARRAFSWSRLFDRLEEVLPANLELARVSPKILSRESSETDLVAIDLKGRAETGDSLLQFVDNLFEHDSFTLPNLQSDNTLDDGGVEFTLKVLYLPSLPLSETVEVVDSTVEEASLETEQTGGDR